MGATQVDLDGPNRLQTPTRGVERIIDPARMAVLIDRVEAS